MQAARADDARYWVGFHLTPYIGPTRIERLIRRFGALERAWHAPATELRSVLDDRALESLLNTRSQLSLDAEMERIERAGIAVVTGADPVYPRLLAEIPAPPPVLYVRGELRPEDAVAVAVVGTRRLTAYGREVTARIAGDLAAAGVTIVSGLARGRVPQQRHKLSGGADSAPPRCGPGSLLIRSRGRRAP